MFRSDRSGESETPIRITNESIPEKTKSELEEEERLLFQKIFEGESLSGLNTENRRTRKTSFKSVEELLREEFKEEKLVEVVDEYKSPASKVPFSVPAKESTPGFLEPQGAGYKMVLKTPVLEHQNSTPEHSFKIETHSGRLSPLEERPVRHIKPSLIIKKRLLPKLNLNLSVKKSLKKTQSEKRLFKSRLVCLLRKLGVSSSKARIFIEAGGGELQELDLKAIRLVGTLEESASSVPRINTSRPYVPATFEIQYYKVEELSKKSFTRIAPNVSQEHSTSCGGDWKGCGSTSHVLCFDEGLILNVLSYSGKLHGLDIAPVAAFADLRYEMFVSSNLLELDQVLRNEMEALWSTKSVQSAGTPQGAARPETAREQQLQLIYSRMRGLLDNKENLSFSNYERVSATTPTKDDASLFDELPHPSPVRRPRLYSFSPSNFP